jgi:3D (Asp-Asp-Asp) domain-containing protein
LVKLGWLGHWVYIKGHGVYLASDVMGKSIKGYAIDIVAPSLTYAKEKGRVMAHATKLPY